MLDFKNAIVELVKIGENVRESKEIDTETADNLRGQLNEIITECNYIENLLSVREK